jgi:hypothetical protein
MNRRSALAAALGAAIPATTLAQDPFEGQDPGAPDPIEPEPARGFQGEPGQSWQVFDLARYTRLAASSENPAPQNAVVEWVLRRTGNSHWHGEKLAVLSASKTKLRAYHDRATLDQVGEIVRRFTKATADTLSVRVRFAAAADTRWRYAVMNRLTKLAEGPQGQAIWTLKVEDAAYVRAQMEIYQNYRMLADQTVKVVNGQTLTIKSTAPVDYIPGARREGSVGLGYVPTEGKLEEGITLRFSPLLTYDGDALDAAIELTANTVRRLIKTQIVTRREVGPGDMAITVPEATETRLNQTVKNWPLSQALLIAGGITPGILGTKGGWMNLRIPGTVPTDTELLVFINVTLEEPDTARNDSDRSATRRPSSEKVDR